MIATKVLTNLLCRYLGSVVQIFKQVHIQVALVVQLYRRLVVGKMIFLLFF